MSDTPARLLRLLSLLQNARDWPGSELAERLEVSGRTIRRDVERLRSLGYPVEATVGPVGGYRLAAGAAMPPLLLDDDEALAIALGLRTVVGQAIGGVDEASVRALAKLQQVLPARLRARVTALSTATMQMPLPMPSDRTPLDLDVLTEIASAIRAGRRLRFDYRTGDGRQSLRLVEPQGLVVTGRRWYLVAYDVDRDDWRIFRVDRVDDPRPLAGGSAPRPLPAADTATFVQDKLYTLAPTYEAVATLQMPAGEATNRIGEFTGDIESIDDRRCRVRLASDTLGWLGIRLMLLGCDFTVEEPPELVAYLRDLGERVLRAGA